MWLPSTWSQSPWTTRGLPRTRVSSAHNRWTVPHNTNWCFLLICLLMVWTLKTNKNSEHCTHTIPFLSLSSTSQSSLKDLLLPAFRWLLLLPLGQGTESSFAPSSTLLMFPSSTCTVSVARVERLHKTLYVLRDYHRGCLLLHCRSRKMLSCAVAFHGQYTLSRHLPRSLVYSQTIH